MAKRVSSTSQGKEEKIQNGINLDVAVANIEDIKEQEESLDYKIINGQKYYKRTPKSYDYSRTRKLEFPHHLVDHSPELYYQWIHDSEGQLHDAIENRGFVAVKITKDERKKGENIRVRVGTDGMGQPLFDVLIACLLEDYQTGLLLQQKHAKSNKKKEILSDKDNIDGNMSSKYYEVDKMGQPVDGVSFSNWKFK